MSKPAMTPVMGTVGVLVCLAMAVVGWQLGGSDGQDVGGGAEAGPSTKAGDRSGIRAYRARSAAAQGRVSAISQGSTPGERMRATIELAQRLPVEDFEDWLEGGWFNHRAGYELTLFRKLVEERWRQEDPEGFVVWCLEEGESGSVASTGIPKGAAMPVLREWAINDPERLARFFGKYPDDGLEAQLISRLAKENPSVALERLKEMVARGTRNDYRLSGAIQDLATASPELVREAMEGLPDTVRFQAESALVRHGLEESFETTMRELWARPDGWRLFLSSMSQSDKFSQNLLGVLSELPPSWKNSLGTSSVHSMFYRTDSKPWLEVDLEASGFRPDQAKRIRQYALDALVSRQPEEAMKLLAEGGLDEESRNRAINSLFQRTQGNQEQAEEWLAMLGSAEERATAQAILDSAQERQATSRVSYDTPEDWFEGLRNQPEEDGGVSSYYMANAMRSWGPEQHAKALEMFTELPAVEQESLAEAIVGNHGSYLNYYPREFRAEVVKVMVEKEAMAGEPAEDQSGRQSSQTLRVAVTTAVNWAREDPGGATEWLETLSDGTTKEWAQKNVAASWAEFDPDAMEQWLQTLPAERQDSVKEYLESR